MRNLNERTIAQTVLKSNDGADDGHLQEALASPVQHLHAFAREINLTEG